MQEDYTGIFPEKTITYASFWERFAAAFIDGLILMVVNFFISLLFGGSHASTDDNSFSWGWNISNENPIASLLQILVGWLYTALQESSAAQATLGKRAMGIKVADMQGERISFLRATGRHFGKFISSIILFIGFLMMLWDDKKQTLHDKMAGTLVTKS